MSLGATGPATRSTQRSVAPRLHALPTAWPDTGRRPGGRAFVVLVVLVLASGLVGLLLLNTAMQRSAFRLEELQQTSAALAVRGEVLDTQVERLRAPDRLARAASRLGMVAMPAPVFLRLSDGRVLGDPRPAVAAVARPTAEPAPQSQPRTSDPPTRGGGG